MIELVEEFTLITHLVFLLILVHHGNLMGLEGSFHWLMFEFLLTFTNTANIVLSQAAWSVQRESSGTSNWKIGIALVSY